MQISGVADIEAAREDVWAFLLDPGRVSACVPGIEEVREVGPATFTGVMTAAVGPLTGHFAFRAAIAEADPPASLAAEIDGTDDLSRSTVRTRLAIRLEPLAAERTRLRHDATVDIDGRLAIVGDMIVRATAGAMFAQFVRRMGDELALGSGPAPAQPPAPAERA